MINISPKKILVVDDNDIFREALKTGLEDAGYEVKPAIGGKVAQHLISLQDFDLVIADIRMEEGNGIELLHFIKRSKPIPVILMTGFAELTETKEAYDLGADEFIPKPFKREELLEAVKVCLDEKDAPQPTVTQEADYCKLGIDDFTSGKQILYDIFIRLSSDKFVKIAHQGEDLPMDQVRAYKAKNIRFLYMKKEDFRKYIGFNLNLAQALKTAGKVTKVKKLNFLKHTGEVIMEQLHLSGVDEEAFDNAKALVETTTSVLSDDKDAFDLLMILNSHADFLYAHSLGVSLYGSMLARQLRWTSSTTLFKIAMGGLMHDIGKKEIDRAILLKARKDLSAEEVKILESHPMRGKEILGQIKAVPGDVLAIVGQHHENYVGRGYPLGLKKDKIHPLARLISVVNEFCNLALKTPTHPGMSPPDTIHRMTTLFENSFDPNIFMTLMKMFDIDPPESMTDPHKRKKAA